MGFLFGVTVMCPTIPCWVFLLRRRKMKIKTRQRKPKAKRQTKKTFWHYLKDFANSFCLVSLFVALVFIPTSQSFALPQIEEVVSGSVDFVNTGSTLTINATDKAIVNYSSFDIAQGESVIVNLPNASSEFLNRVTSGIGTSILGSLTCNGIILLVNEAGIYFGPTANIDVAGLVASTRDITNSDFLSSNYVFSRLSKEQLDTLLLNEGNIHIREGGFGVFIAGSVENSGTIIAPLGTIAIGAAEMVTLNMAGEGLISIAINKEQAEAVFTRHGAIVTKQVNNTGTISAPGGSVLIKA
ncbi:MAG: filamentous hemagglutinin N-terminal domain-containing protein, partial [Candidatus Omnitrophica bacterium]|nr:filamentous hemagglutinin N-terminal domain-containing protein [Candidatus Omnitrophota bacterium]